MAWKGVELNRVFQKVRKVCDFRPCIYCRASSYYMRIRLIMLSLSHRYIYLHRHRRGDEGLRVRACDQLEGRSHTVNQGNYIQASAGNLQTAWKVHEEGRAIKGQGRGLQEQNSAT